MIGRQFVARLLIIVSRTNPAQHTYLKHVFGSQTEDVILDRRVGKRRQRLAPVAAGKPRNVRRPAHISQELQLSRWDPPRRMSPCPHSAPAVLSLVRRTC